MAPVHPVAAEGFGSDGERYHFGRPGYPGDAIEWLVASLALGPGTLVADVGAGTGKLTADLVSTGASIVAVEPVASMSEVLARTAPTVPIVAAAAESLPFRDASLDAISCAQAFHWFDRGAAWAEFLRVLRPGGAVGLIWNARDHSIRWVDAVWRVMDEVEKHAPWRDHDTPTLEAGRGFEPLDTARFWHDVPVTKAMMMARIASVSHVAVLPDAEHRAVLDRVAAAVPDDPDLTVRYRVDVYATRIAGGQRSSSTR